MKMESVAKKLFVGTGLVLSAAMAMIPLTSYAAVITEEGGKGTPNSYRHCYDDNLSNGGSPVTVPCEKGVQVAFNVMPTITIDALAAPGVEGSAGPIVLSPTVIREGQITATVIANSKYSLSLSADHGITAMQHETNKDALIPASSNLVGGTAGWGIKTSGTTEGEGTYAAITDTPVPYVNPEDTSITPTGGTTHAFTVGVAASPNLPSGIYQATVVVTATATK